MIINQNKLSVALEKVKISNPNKMLWPELEIRKIDYLKFLIEIAPFLLPYTKNRYLTTIRYPDGVHGKSFFQKNVPNYSPEWIETIHYKGNDYILLDNIETLVWLGNQAALEFHTSFNYIQTNIAPHLVFDLDPSEGQVFGQVVEVALKIKEVLDQLGINCTPKTSGATGLQLFIPIQPKYTYEEARKMNQFFGMYFASKYPNLITIERSVNKRKQLLYFDYLQMWKGKTMISVYSPRATPSGAVSAPITWSELEHGITNQGINMTNIIHRLDNIGDLFQATRNEESKQDLDFIMEHIQ